MSKKKKKLRLRKEVKQFAVCAAGIALLNICIAMAATVKIQRANAEELNGSETEKTIEVNEVLSPGTNAAVVTRLSDGAVIGYKELPASEKDVSEEPEKTEVPETTLAVSTGKSTAGTGSLTASRNTSAYDYQAQVSYAPAPEPVYQEPYYEEAPQEYTESYEQPAETYYEPQETYSYDGSNYDGAVLNPTMGVVYGPSGKETYYNLDMSGVLNIMRGMGNSDQYWVREDGAKMLGDYVIVAANLDNHPRGSLVETSLGTGIVCDTGGFAYQDPNQIDIATAW